MEFHGSDMRGKALRFGQKLLTMSAGKQDKYNRLARRLAICKGNMKKIMAVQMLFMVLSPVFLGIAFGSWILEELHAQV
eukprot:689835-Amphidinium_carterae.1